MKVWIWIEKTCWFRIRIQLIRIRNTAKYGIPVPCYLHDLYLPCGSVFYLKIHQSKYGSFLLTTVNITQNSEPTCQLDPPGLAITLTPGIRPGSGSSMTKESLLTKIGTVFIAISIQNEGTGTVTLQLKNI